MSKAGDDLTAKVEAIRRKLQEEIAHLEDDPTDDELDGITARLKDVKNSLDEIDPSVPGSVVDESDPNKK